MNLVLLAALLTITYTLSTNDFHLPAQNNIIYTHSFEKSFFSCFSLLLVKYLNATVEQNI